MNQLSQYIKTNLIALETPNFIAGDNGSVEVKTKINSLAESAENDGIETQDLYETGFEDSLYLTSIKLLNDALDIVDKSRGFLKQNEKISSDNELIYLDALLNELFCLRQISDSFGLIILSCKNAVRNRTEIGLNDAQLISIRYALYSVKNLPLMSFTKAVEITESLEQNGLEINTKEIEVILDWLCD